MRRAPKSTILPSSGCAAGMMTLEGLSDPWTTSIAWARLRPWRMERTMLRHLLGRHRPLVGKHVRKALAFNQLRRDEDAIGLLDSEVVHHRDVGTVEVAQEMGGLPEAFDKRRVRNYRA